MKRLKICFAGVEPYLLEDCIRTLGQGGNRVSEGVMTLLDDAPATTGRVLRISEATRRYVKEKADADHEPFEDAFIRMLRESLDEVFGQKVKICREPPAGKEADFARIQIEYTDQPAK